MERVKRLFTAKNLKNFGMINVGTLLVALGVYFFRIPNNFSTGGVTGISVILAKLMPGVSTGAFISILNYALLGLGFLLINGSFGVRTVYSTTLFSGIIMLLEHVVPMDAPMTSQPFLELIFSILLPAFGSAILFDADASTGGTDILAMILKKYTHMEVGRGLLCADASIAIASCVVFGMETGLYSVMGLLLKSVLVDSLMESFNINKYFHIITDKPNTVCDYIVKEFNRSATILRGEGYYTHSEKTVLLVVLNRPQAAKLNQFLRRNVPGSFVAIMNTSNIIGKGFRDRA
ncbi:MAG: YitT family protein [Eubacteriales bacterium]|nr:YitT family protein [Eubacteriales bacterium]